jgi:hypothetical protein
LRVTICWTEFAGYTAACWRELASRADVDLRILAWPSNLSRSGTQFDRALVGGLPVRFLEGAEQQDRDLVARLVADHDPEMLMIGGWAEAPYRALATDAKRTSARLVLAMDTPWKGTLRQRLARLKIGGFIDRLDGIFVPGKLGERFARHLRMPEDRIFTGMLGFALFTWVDFRWRRRWTFSPPDTRAIARLRPIRGRSLAMDRGQCATCSKVTSALRSTIGCNRPINPSSLPVTA